MKFLIAVDGSDHARRAVEVVGRLAQEIARLVHAQRVHQIVMGPRSMNALAGLVPGSVAQRVVHLTHVLVLVVK